MPLEATIVLSKQIKQLQMKSEILPIISLLYNYIVASFWEVNL